MYAFTLADGYTALVEHLLRTKGPAKAHSQAHAGKVSTKDSARPGHQDLFNSGNEQPS